MKILLIIPYFGKTPDWIEYFLISCSYNKSVNWLLYGDLEINKQRIPSNVFVEKKNISDFNQLASKKLSLKINVTNPYKLCDLRPAFGKIFEDKTNNYDYWGYCDIDIIFGDIYSILDPAILKQSDIISCGDSYLAGPFTLYKNNEKNNLLFCRITNYKRKMQDFTRHYYLDEKSNYIGERYAEYLTPGKSIVCKIANRAINSIMFRFLKSIPRNYDITKLALRLEKQGKLRIWRVVDYTSDELFIQAGYKSWQIKWSEGFLTNTKNNNNLLLFHFLKSKKENQFTIDKNDSSVHFTITERGIIS